MSSLSLAVNHLNVPYGSVLTADQLADALREGSVEIDTIPSQSAALICSVFNEVSPQLLLSCMLETGSDIHTVNKLYEETLKASMPRSPQWEQSIEHFL